MKLIGSLFIWLSCFLLTNSIHAQSGLGNELDSFLKKNFRANEPGAAVLVLEKGKVVYQNGIGLADLETKSLITSTTTFRMASVSKQFTAMAILLLEKDKKLKLDDKLSVYFPKLQPSMSNHITLAHLLTHTSGIPDYENLMDSTWKRQISDEDIPILLQKQTKGYFEPGSRFKYSNTAFCLLSLIVQKVSGLPYPVFMQINIFDPLGMKNTFLYDNKQPRKPRGMGYARDESGHIVPSDQSLTSATKGDGCVYTSTEDYLKWYQAIRDNRLVDLQKELTEVGHKFPQKTNSGYGLGWFFNETKSAGKYELTHTGSTCGFSNAVLMIPYQDLMIAYFSNIADNHAPFSAILKIAKANLNTEWTIDWKAMHDFTD